MSKLKQAIADAVEKLGLTNALLARSKRRYLKFHKRAVQNHRLAIKSQERAEKASGAERDRQTKKAARAHARAFKSHLKAQYWVGKVKQYTQRVEDLEHTKEQIEAELADWIKTHGISFKGNVVSGGTARQRLRACMLKSAANCASGKRPNFYSQSGTYDVKHCLTGEPYGHRSDCSSWFASAYWSCGLKDPNGLDWSGGYTGTLAEHGHIISESELKPGDAVLFGTAPFHHVEAYCGPGNKTIGHGSAAVDAGTTSLLPGPRAFRSYLKEK